MNEEKPNIKIFIGLIVGILVVFLGFIAINQYTISSGEDLFLKTIPVDPRDPLRGDYVILSYEFEQDEQLKEFIVSNNIQSGMTLYLSFIKDSQDVGTLSSISETEPTQGIFLRVEKLQDSWGSLRLETGIDKFFVPEGTGRTIERVRGDMLVHAKVDNFGNAKIIDLYYKGEKIDPKSFEGM